MGLARFELATYGLGNRRSIHLSYSPPYAFILPLFALLPAKAKTQASEHKGFYWVNTPCGPVFTLGKLTASFFRRIFTSLSCGDVESEADIS